MMHRSISLIVSSVLAATGYGLIPPSGADLEMPTPTSTSTPVPSTATEPAEDLPFTDVIPDGADEPTDGADEPTDGADEEAGVDPNPGKPEQTVTGELARLAVDFHDGTEALLQVVMTDDGDAIRVQDHPEIDDVPEGSVIEVDLAEPAPEEAAIDDPEGGAEVLAATVLEDPEATPSLMAASSLNTDQRAVHVRTVRINGQSDGVAAGTIANEVTSQVAPYWSDSTAGVIRFSVETATAAAAFSTSLTGCPNDLIFDLFDHASQGIETGTGRHVLIYTPRYSACGFSGVAVVGDGGSAWINGSDGTRWSTIAHELGHNLTLRHSNSRISCAGGAADGTSSACRNGEYGDAYDVMGVSTGGTGPLNAAHLDALGLLTSSSAVRATGPVTTTLAPVGTLSGKRFLTFRSGTARYYVEHRAAVGRDSTLASQRLGCPAGVASCSLTRYKPGVTIRRIDSTTPGGTSYLLDAGVADGAARASEPWFVLPVGRSFTTSGGSHTIRVRSASSSGATVELLNGALNLPHPQDQLALIPTTKTIQRGQSVSTSIAWKVAGLAQTGAVTLQHRVNGSWRNAYTVPVANGQAKIQLKPSSTKAYRLRAAHQTSMTKTITVRSSVSSSVAHPLDRLALVPTTKTITRGSSVAAAVVWNVAGVPDTGSVMLQHRVNGSWRNAYTVPVVNGKAKIQLKPSATKAYRLRAAHQTSMTKTITVR